MGDFTSDLIPWFDKRWAFSGTPTGAWPEILERIRGTPPRLEELVRLTAPDRLTAAPPSGQWTIQEHIGHLLDLEDLPDGRLDDFLAGSAVLRAADLTNRKTFEAGHDAVPVADLVASFRERRAELVRRFEALDPEAWGITALHPRLETPMRVLDMLIFQADHDTWHLARIRELGRG